MKPNKPIVFACIAAIALISSLGSCSQQNMPDDQSGSPLSIRVVDGGYRSDHAPAQPRLGSQDNDDYTTDFTAGDQIGVYAVKDGVIVNGIDNLKLTALAVGSDIGWQADGDKSPLVPDAGVSYYAYYPYQATLTSDQQPDLLATDATAFFKKLTDSWTVAKDQSTQALYTASDLMVSKGKVANSTLTFTMGHRMALAVMDFRTTKAHYIFSNTTPSISDYSVSAPPMPIFAGFKPWHSTDYVFRYLVNPTDDQKKRSLVGGYQRSSQGWVCPLKNIVQGAYHTFEISDLDAPVEVTYDLEPGDFLLKDGILIAKATTLDDVYKAAARAVVFKVGQDANGDNIDTGRYKIKDGTADMTLHGYAIAFFDANLNGQQLGQPCSWSLKTNQSVATIATVKDFMGYYNTKKINAAVGPGSVLKTDYPACYWTTQDYENKYPAPVNSSGWFLPSCGQLKYLFDKQNSYVSSITQAGGRLMQQYNYWSSSEYSSNPAANASDLFFLDGNDYYYTKTRTYYVRSVIAF